MEAMSILNIISNWQEDCKINKVDPDNDLLKIPNLHSKYSAQVVLHSIAHGKKLSELSKLKKIKTEYYSGKLNNTEDLKKYGLEPFPFKLKSDIKVYLEADTDINKILLEISNHEEAIKYCKSIVEQIHDRTWQIKAYLDYSKFKIGS